jgi:hypothetical protein
VPARVRDLVGEGCVLQVLDLRVHELGQSNVRAFILVPGSVEAHSVFSTDGRLTVPIPGAFSTRAVGDATIAGVSERLAHLGHGERVLGVVEDHDALEDARHGQQVGVRATCMEELDDPAEEASALIAQNGHARLRLGSGGWPFWDRSFSASLAPPNRNALPTCHRGG